MAKVAVVSGYKPYELGIFKQNEPSIYYIKLAIRKKLISLLEEGLEWVLISGQLGVELWTAEIVFDLQMEGYEYLQLAVITPFLQQEDKWSDTNKEWYESVLAQADYIDSVSKKGYEKPWQFRMKNQFLIEKSDVLVLLYDTEKEGSPKFMYEMAMSYKQNKDYELQLIDFYELQLAVEEEQLKKQGF
ncbi:DUF1273 domain-containing protein [Robertmurraya mangrovi]|uniref:DUF1273 domain-containing protein n=1 Tax=Robertmurraya mangrovi TaxID=3098077 RepID=UPI002ACC2F0F|nr:DUF1273 domain-containing protein [Bacillus sp. 31A1R]